MGTSFGGIQKVVPQKLRRVDKGLPARLYDAFWRDDVHKLFYRLGGGLAASPVLHFASAVYIRTIIVQQRIQKHRYVPNH
jgi:hypothetical protein